MCHNYVILDNLHEVASEASVSLVKQDTIFKDCEHNWFQIEKDLFDKNADK